MELADSNEGFFVPAKGLSREELEGVLGVMTEQLWPSERQNQRDLFPHFEAKKSREGDGIAVFPPLSEDELEKILKTVLDHLWRGGN